MLSQSQSREAGPTHAQTHASTCSFEFTVVRSANGFVRRTEFTAILEKRDRATGSPLRKVIRAQLPFLETLQDPADLFQKNWNIDSVSHERTPQASRFRGRVRTTDGDFFWDLSLGGGVDLQFCPLPGWVEHQTLATQTSVQGSWSLGEFKWSSAEDPALASVHLRGEAPRVSPSVCFHSQTLTDAAGAPPQLADGLSATPQRFGMQIFPTLTRICAFESLQSALPFSLWQAIRSSMSEDGRGGWTFRTEKSGLEMRGRISAEPKDWVTLRCEDVHGAAFYRTSTRRADLEILVLSHGKPQGHFRSLRSTWLEQTQLEKPESITIY